MGKLKENKAFGIVIMTIKAAITAALLYWVIHSVGLNEKQGFNEFLDAILSADVYILMMSIAFVPVMDLVSTLKWHMLVKFRHVNIGFWKLFAFYVVGKFFNIILPSNIGGDLIRVHLLAKETGQLASSAGIVLIERITGLITLVLLAAIALFIAAGDISESWIKWLVIVAAIGLIGVISVFMVNNVYWFLCRMFEERHPLLKRIFNKIHKMRSAIIDISNNKKALFMAFLNSFLFYVAAIFNAWISVLVFDTSVSLLTMIVAVPIIMFVMNLPVSIGSIGIMEFSYTAVLAAFGIDPVIALSLAILMRLKIFLGAAIGAVTYQFVSFKVSGPVKFEKELNAYNG